jgi:hypothetical protein
MMQYFFGMERPYDKAFEFMFHSNEREEFVQQFWGMPNETIAFSTFLQLYGTWTVTTNHGMAFAISPTWYSRPYAKGTTGELAVLADVAGYTLRPSEAEEKWQRVLKDPDFDDGVTLIAQNGIRDERTYWSAVAKQQGEDAQRNSYNSGKFTHMVGELHPMTSYIVSEHPLFAVEDLSGMPSFTKRQAYKAGIKELEKILRPVVSRFGENETSDNVMQYLLDSYTDDPGRYPIRRLFNSAAGQLKLPAMFLTSMRHDLATANDLDEPASESLVFDCLYFRPFYALSGLGMLRRSLQNLPREKSCPRVQRALEKTVGDQTGRICGDLKISITPVASRVLMMRGTSEVNERWTKKRLYSPDLSSYDSCVPVATDVFDVKDGALDKSVRHPLRAIDVGPPPVREYTTFAPQM